jgi:uncharacterized repeat protein (TIGR01451 family)
MAPTGRRLRLMPFLAMAVCTLCSGCFGWTQNPSYFPWLLPTEDIIQTHAKPPGFGYYANFDPNAVRLEVRPLTQTNPVRTQLVLVATVYDANGKPRRNRRVEWVVEGAGHLVEVDESGCAPGRGYKVDSKYAVSYTNYREHRITRGNADPGDDFVIRPGQTWCVITSAAEGDTYVTAYAPGVYNWEKSRVFLSYHWVDANWEFPPPAKVRAGSEHVLTTTVFRHTDHQPLANYRVRYRILDGPPAVFLPSRTQEAVVVSGLEGHANVAIAQQAPQLGINHISVDIIRPPDPTAPSGVGLPLATGKTSVEWLAPAVVLNHEGPPTAAPGQEITLTTRVQNTGQIESRAMTVTVPLPDGLRYLRSQPPAVLDGRQLIWTLGLLPPGQTHTVQATYQAQAPGLVTSVASVQTEEGLHDEKRLTIQVTQPQLKLTLDAPPTGVTGVPVTYHITVTNPGSGPATNVKVTANFDPALKHETGAQTVNQTLAQLGPLESRLLQPELVLTPQQAGRFKTAVVATADGGLKDQAEHFLTVQQARLGLGVVGPQSKVADRSVEWNIKVLNPGEVALNDVTVHDRLPPELLFEGASQGGVLNNGEVLWTVGTLAPHSERILQVTTRTGKTPGKTIHTVTATAAPNLREQAQATLDILGSPALNLEVVDIGDPAEIGKQVSYQIDVTNPGQLPANQVEIKATVPAEMQPLAGNGPTPAKIIGQVVTFGKLEALQPGQTVRYNVEVRAVKPGDVRFRVELRSLALQSPVREEESTTIIDPSMPIGPPAERPGQAPLPPGPALPPPPPPPSRPTSTATLPASAVPAVPPPQLPLPSH